jgi:hypothetical protein
VSRSRISARKRYVTTDKNDYLGIILIVIVVLIGIGIGLFYFTLKSNTVVLDKRTFCPVNGPISVTALLIDATDSLSFQQKKALSDEFQLLRESIPVYGRLDLYFIESNSVSPLKPIVSICNPGRGSQINPIIGNPIQVERSWKEGFEQPLESQLTLLLNKSPANESPILESVQSVVLTSFSDPVIRDKPRKLIVVSDLMQHSSSVSLYGKSTDANIFTQDKTFSKLKSDLREIDINIWMLVRDNTLKRDVLASFWGGVFSEQGANNVNFCVLVESNRCQNDR